MNKRDHFTINKKTILSMIKEKKYLSQDDLKYLLKEFKISSLVSQNLSFNSFLLKLIDEGLTQYSINIRGHSKVRYTLSKDLSIYAFCETLEKNSYFSMTTALNLQGISKYRNNFIFISKERITRASLKGVLLTQEDIDNAYKKEPKRTKAYDKIGEYIVIFLEANHTFSYEVQEYQGMRVSSINRVFVEIISNVHYFQSTQKVIELFEEIKNHLDIDTIYTIIEKFDFVYPYFQLAGFYLEQIGFTREKLEKFYTQKTSLNFYTQKNKPSYLFDSYWGIFY